MLPPRRQAFCSQVARLSHSAENLKITLKELQIGTNVHNELTMTRFGFGG